MPSFGKSQQNICLTRPPYPEFFLRVFGNDGKLSYKVKCISIGFILYGAGLLVNVVSGTWLAFINDIGFLTNSLLVGIIVCGVLAICKQVNSTLDTMNKVIGHSKKNEFRSFLEKWNGEPVWFVKERYWYHFHTISLTVMISLWSLFGLIGNYGWVIETAANRLYYILWSGVIGYSAGIAVNRYGNYTFLINQYCADFVEPSKLRFLSSATRKAFESLGKLAVRADLVVAIPTIAILVNSLSYWIETGEILPFSKFPHLLMMLAYICTLIFVFFYPLKNAHERMVQIKNREIQNIDNDLSSFLGDVGKGIHVYSNIDSALSLRDRLGKMSTWPLSLRSTISASLIFLLPVLTGAAIQLFLEYVLSAML